MGLNNVVFHELRRWINLFFCFANSASLREHKKKSRKDAKDSKEKNTTLYLGYYLFSAKPNRKSLLI